MSTLNPQLQGDVGFDRPVQQAPSALGALASVAGTVLDGYSSVNQPRQRTADERKNDALSPLANQLDEIYNMDISQNERDRLYNRAVRGALVAYPELRTDISGLGEQYGYSLMQEDTTVQAEAAFLEWQASPVGQAAVATLAVGNGNGGLDDAATRQKVQEYYLTQQTELMLATNLANSEAGDDRKWRQLSFNWSEQSADFAEGLVVQASQSEEFLKNPEEVMQLLNSTIIARTATIRESAAMAGISPQYVEAHIAEVIKPITDLRETYNNMADDTTKMIRALETAQQHGVVQQFIELNPVFADEAARNVFLQYFIAGNFTDETAAQFFQTTKDLSDSNRFDLSLTTVPLTPSNAEIVNGGSPINPDSINEARQKYIDNPEAATTEMNMFLSSMTSADVSTDAGKNQFEQAVVNATLISEALDRPIGYETLNQLLSPDVINRANAFEEGSNVQQSMLSLITRQFVQHRRSIDGRSDITLAVENNRFIALRPATPLDQRQGTVRPDGLVEVRRENVREATPARGRNPAVPARAGEYQDKSVRALNVLWDAAKQDPVIRDSVATQFNLLNAGHTTTPEIQTLQEMANGDGPSELRNISITPNQPPMGIANYEAVANDTPFIEGVAKMSRRLGADPVHIMQAISFETVGTFSAGVKNPGSSATGLIQFIESTARDLGTTTEKLGQMSRTEQLPYVEKYLQRFSGRLNNLGDVYMAIHWPAGVGKEDTYVMYRQGTAAYEPNRNLDLNNDGVITRGEAVARVMQHNGRSPGSFPDMSNAGNDGVFASDGQPMDIVRPEARGEQDEGVQISTSTAPSAPPPQAQSVAPTTSDRPVNRDQAAASRSLTQAQRGQLYSRLRQGGEIDQILAEILGTGEANGQSTGD